MATVNVALNVQVTGGPQMLVSKAISIEAYDKIEVTVEPGTTQTVEIQPGVANRVSFLLIKSNLYSENDATKKLTYVVNDGSVDAASTIELDEPHLFLGRGAASVFGLAPRVLKFTSTYVGTPTTPNRAAIEILVGRDPTP